MSEYIATIGPISVGIVIYFIRLESRLSKIMTELCWIKKELSKNAGNIRTKI